MKQLLLFLFVILLAACNQQTASVTNAHHFAIDSLSAQLKELKEKYKPGLGEIMASIQMHHAKLWFSGINDNWKLAEYEVKELKERIEQAKNIETDRPEMKDIPIIYAALDSITIAVINKNQNAFKSTYSLLTNTCNTCHKAVNFEFNVVTIPTTLPVSNQDFKVQP
jgi:hypothetical protein